MILIKSNKEAKTNLPTKKEIKIDWDLLEKADKILESGDKSEAEKLIEELKKLRPKNNNGENIREKLIEDLQGQFNL